MSLLGPVPQPNEFDPSWTGLRAFMDRESLSDSRRQACLWALDHLEHYLGSAWVGQAFANEDALRQPLILAGGHIDADLFLIELALRLEALRDVPGMADVRRSIKRSVLYALAVHTQLQLETAALASSHGADVAVEVSLAGGSSPIDLVVTIEGRVMPVEAKVLLTDQNFRQSDEMSDRIGYARLAFEVRHGVTLDVVIDQIPPDVDAAIAFVERAAIAAVLASGVVEREEAGVQVVAHPGRDHHKSQFMGPRIETDLWLRITDALQEKAAKLYADRPVWLRLDAKNGLWQLTPWARSSLTDKTTTVADAVREDLGGYDVAGVVLSSGAGRALGETDDDTVGSTSEGLVGLRRTVEPGRVRETIIVLLDEAYPDEAEVWLRLYDAEPAWLDTALADAGLPSVGEIMATDP